MLRGGGASGALADTTQVAAASVGFDFSLASLTQSGEFWMLMAAQSMALGTVMVRCESVRECGAGGSRACGADVKKIYLRCW